jgi:hypothetical protein
VEEKSFCLAIKQPHILGKKPFENHSANAPDTVAWKYIQSVVEAGFIHCTHRQIADDGRNETNK